MNSLRRHQLARLPEAGWAAILERRAGRACAGLVKRLHGVTLQRDTTWCERAELAELSA